jgi:hypothetical protein
VQHKISTANNLLVKDIPCDPVCALCSQEAETADHLCLHCVFAKEVWLAVQVWSENLIAVPDSRVSLVVWWNSATKSKQKDTRSRIISIMIYTVWNLWKERNRRILEGKSTSPSQVLNFIREEAQLRRVACGDVAPLAGGGSLIMLAVLLCSEFSLSYVISHLYS